jgi:hypothetical protein
MKSARNQEVAIARKVTIGRIGFRPEQRRIEPEQGVFAMNFLPSGQGQIQERRSSPRQRQRTRILFLSNDSVLDEPFRGVLLDSSSGGVRLAVRMDDMVEGTMLLVRPPSAPAGTPWIPVTVRNRRLAQHTWEVGCQFLRSLPSNTLQMFAS